VLTVVGLAAVTVKHSALLLSDDAV
jgi:hypothetical protein